ncbi:MAG: hypothetical protein QNK37_22670 [Acidobacteriota bacterium]|nr:hypothetical protein [Acidobacteriota bacterium]
MKKTSIIAIALFCMGMIAAWATVPDLVDKPDSCECPSSGGTVHYVRKKNRCDNDPKKYEYSCFVGGNEKCEVQNCP